MSKIYVARVFAYETPSESAKGAASVGMSVASKLNGDADWVGTFNPERAFDGRKVGFITNPNKFTSLQAAEEAAKKLANKFPRGYVMPSDKWAWGETMYGDGVPEGTHEIIYVKDDERIPQPADMVREAATSSQPTT